MIRKRQHRSDNVLPGASSPTPRSTTSPTQQMIAGGCLAAVVLVIFLWPAAHNTNNKESQETGLVAHGGSSDTKLNGGDPHNSDAALQSQSGADNEAQLATDAPIVNFFDRLSPAEQCIFQRLERTLRPMPQSTLRAQSPSFFAIRRMEDVDGMLGMALEVEHLAALRKFEIDVERNASQLVAAGDFDRAADVLKQPYPLQADQERAIPRRRFSLDLSECSLGPLVAREDFVSGVLVPLLVRVRAREFGAEKQQYYSRAPFVPTTVELASDLIARDLVMLDLGSNSIRRLSSEFHAMFPSLEILFLSGNLLDEVPPSIAKLQRLTRLSLKSNLIEVVDPARHFPPSIEHLILTENRIVRFDSSFCDVIDDAVERRLVDHGLALGADARGGKHALPDEAGVPVSFGRLRKLMLAGNQLSSIVPALFPHDLEAFNIASAKWRTAYLSFLTEWHRRHNIVQSAAQKARLESLDQRFYHEHRRIAESNGAPVGVELDIAAESRAIGAHVPPFCAMESLELLRVTRNNIQNIDEPHSVEDIARIGRYNRKLERSSAKRRGEGVAAVEHGVWAKNSAIGALTKSDITDRTVIAACRRLSWVSFAGNDAVNPVRLQEEAEAEVHMNKADPRGQLRREDRSDDAADAGDGAKAGNVESTTHSRQRRGARFEPILKILPSLTSHLDCRESGGSNGIRVLGSGTSGIVKLCVLEVPDTVADEAYLAAVEEELHAVAVAAGLPHLGQRRMYVVAKFFRRISSDGSANDERNILSTLRQHPHLIAPIGSAVVTLRSDDDWRGFFPTMEPRAVRRSMDFNDLNQTVAMVFPFVPAMRPLGIAPDIATVTDVRYPGPIQPFAAAGGASGGHRRFEFDRTSASATVAAQKSGKGAKGQVAFAVALRHAITEWVRSPEVRGAFVSKSGGISARDAAIVELLRDLPEAARLTDANVSSLIDPLHDAVGVMTRALKARSAAAEQVANARAAPEGVSIADFVDRPLYARLVVTTKLLLDVAEALDFLHHRAPPLLTQSELLEAELREVQEAEARGPAGRKAAAEARRRTAARALTNPTHVSVAHGDLYAHNIFFSIPPIVHRAVSDLYANGDRASAGNPAANDNNAGAAGRSDDEERDEHGPAATEVAAELSELKRKLLNGGGAAQKLKALLQPTPWQRHEGLVSDFGASFAYRDTVHSTARDDDAKELHSSVRRRKRPLAFEKTEVRAFGIFAHEMVEHIIGVDFVALKELPAVTRSAAADARLVDSDAHRKRDGSSVIERRAQERLAASASPSDPHVVSIPPRVAIGGADQRSGPELSARELAQAVKVERVAVALDELRDLIWSCTMVSRAKRPSIAEIIDVLAGIVSLL